MEGEGVKVDGWGYPVRTSSDACISAINSYYNQVLAYGRKRAVILEAPNSDRDCVMANILAAYFLASSGNSSSASSHLEAAKARLEKATSYEKAVFNAINSLMEVDRDDDMALDMHSKLLKDFPRDLLSLKRVQMLCFYLGRPDISLQLVEQVLPQNQQESYIYGMLAFPLLELGRMDEAEKAARKGLEINQNDVWAQHNLCHVFQYESRFKDAVEFMEECSSTWNSCLSFMYTHNWWHVAICYLEGHSPLQKVLEIYDNCILQELQKIDAEAGEVYLNALGLLLRAYVRGHMSNIEDRLATMTSCLTDQSTWNKEWLLDLLALWALASNEKAAAAESLLNSMKSRFCTMSKKKQQLMQRAILLAEALYEFGKGNCQRVLELLGPDFDAIDFKMIGASDEQLDVFNEVWYIVLLDTGNFLKAIDELENRIKKTGGSPFLWRLLEKAYSMAGRGDACAEAKENAKALEVAYFVQTV